MMREHELLSDSRTEKASKVEKVWLVAWRILLAWADPMIRDFLTNEMDKGGV